MDKMRLTASERESLIRFSVAHDILESECPKLIKRFQGMRYGKRDIGLIRSKIGRLMEAAIETIPDEQLRSYAHSLEMSTYTIGVKKPTNERNDREYGMWLSFEVLNALLEGCHDKCMMCPADKAERRACRLRKALSTIPNDAPERDDGDCPYYTIM